MNEPAPSEQVLRHAYDEAAVGLCYFDTNLRYLHINNWLARLNGVPVEKHLGRTVHEVIPKVAAGVANELRQVIETSTPIMGGTVEAETPARPNVLRTFMHNYLPVVADGGQVIGVSCLVQDVTARREAEVSLEARTAELEQANRDLQLALDPRGGGPRHAWGRSLGSYCSLGVLPNSRCAAQDLPRFWVRPRSPGV